MAESGCQACARPSILFPAQVLMIIMGEKTIRKPDVWHSGYSSTLEAEAGESSHQGQLSCIEGPCLKITKGQSGDRIIGNLYYLDRNIGHLYYLFHSLLFGLVLWGRIFTSSHNLPSSASWNYKQVLPDWLFFFSSWHSVWNLQPRLAPTSRWPISVAGVTDLSHYAQLSLYFLLNHYCYVCARTPDAPVGQKRPPAPLELALHRVVRHHVGAEKQTQVLCKNSKAHNSWAVFPVLAFSFWKA